MEVLEAMHAKLKLECDARSKIYESNGVVTKFLDLSTPQAVILDDSCKDKIVEVDQTTFGYGTLRVLKPCMIRFKSNVSFNPMATTDWDKAGTAVNGTQKDGAADWLPAVSSDGTRLVPYDAQAYRLGFFAAIAVETTDVIIDLNGYVLEQSKVHQMQQRFYANIELASAPFVMQQGPAKFGSRIMTASRCHIKNGTLGRSSHHGIHGNDNSDILLENLNVRGFEVAGIALNGPLRCVFKCVTCDKGTPNTPVLGTYSAARFVRSFLDQLVKGDHADSLFNGKKGSEIKAELLQVMDNQVHHVLHGTDLSAEAASLFHNSSGLTDGNTYGILLNPPGVAVHSFLESRVAAEAADVYFEDVSINGIKAKINEVVALSKIGELTKPLVGPVGDVVQIMNIINESDGTYKSNVLSDAQTFLGKYVSSLVHKGTLSVDSNFVKWAEGEINMETLMKDRVFLCNGDSMFHTNKGVLGLKVDGINRFGIRNMIVRGIANSGHWGSTSCGEYVISHPKSGSQQGFSGRDTRAIGISSCHNGHIHDTIIRDVCSMYGHCYGVHFMNESSQIQMKNVVVSDMRSGCETKMMLMELRNDPTVALLPNGIPRTYGVKCDHKCIHVRMQDINVRDIIGFDTATEIAIANLQRLI